MYSLFFVGDHNWTNVSCVWLYRANNNPLFFLMQDKSYTSIFTFVQFFHSMNYSLIGFIAESLG